MRFLLTAALVTLAPAPAFAQDTVDQQIWVQVLATIPLSDNWRLHLEEWPRFSHDQNGAFQIITRTALGRRLGTRTTLWGGYAWVAKPPGPGVTHEQRTWQQLSATLPNVEQWTPSLRIRLEQRVQDNWADASHRLRTMGRFVRRLNASGTWSLAAWDELMVTFDDTASGPAQGYDQNRLFGGLLRQFTRAVGFEFGYMWQTAKPPSSAATHAHVAYFWLNITP
jgi:hypothetical protein